MNRELVFDRVLHAPIDLVFEVWTNPEHLAQWYGPKGFGLTTHAMDLRPGGIWDYTMHGPDGRDYHNKVVFTQIEKPGLLVYKHIVEADTEPVGHEMTIRLLDQGETTHVTMRLVFDSPQSMQMVAHHYGAVEGGVQTLDRLQRLLAVLTNPLLKVLDNQIVSTRLFDVSPEQLFQAWTNPDTLAQWWGPAGFSNTFHQFECKPGGQWNFTMHGPDGKDYHNQCIFIAVTPPLQLIWRHLSQPEFYVIANFEKELGQTRAVFKMIFNCAETCEKVKKYAVSANEENFDRLETQLERIFSEPVTSH